MWASTLQSRYDVITGIIRPGSTIRKKTFVLKYHLIPTKTAGEEAF